MQKQTVQHHDSRSLAATFLPRMPLLSNRPVHYGIYSEQSGNGTGSLHQCSALNCLFFPHGATDPSRPGLPHYRGFKITLKTHHIR